MAKRRVLLVDDEVTVLLTMKAVLEISGFDVDTAASAMDARRKLKLGEYQMVITDMRMESDVAGCEVIAAARMVTGAEIPTREAPRRPGDPPMLVAASERIRAELGWEARKPELGQMVADAWAFMQARPDGYSQ